MEIEKIKSWAKDPAGLRAETIDKIDWLIAEHDRLTAENANLRATVRGKTMYHSDEDVNREMGMLRAKNEKLLEALEKIAHSNGRIAGVPCQLSDPYYVCREVARQALKEGSDGSV